MSKVIDIAVVFDTETIEEKYGAGSHDSNNPHDVSHDDVYMIARQAIVNSGQATGDLSVNAVVNDAIHWRAESLSGNSGNSVVIYKVDKYSGVNVTSTPELRVTMPAEPIPDESNPTSYAINKDQYDAFLSCEVERTGNEGYRIWFYIVNKDPDTGDLGDSPYGFYRWDPTLEVKN